MENLNPPKNTLFYPCSIAIFTEISGLQQIGIFFKIKRHTANPDTPLRERSYRTFSLRGSNIQHNRSTFDKLNKGARFIGTTKVTDLKKNPHNHKIHNTPLTFPSPSLPDPSSGGGGGGEVW